MRRKGTKKDAKADVWVDVSITVYFRDQQKPLVIAYRHKAGVGGNYWEYFRASEVRHMLKIVGYRETHIIDADAVRRLKLKTRYSDDRDEQPDHRPKAKK